MKIGVEGEGPCTDILEITRPENLRDIADLGLTLAEAKRLLAGVQREIVAAQAGTTPFSDRNARTVTVLAV